MCYAFKYFVFKFNYQCNIIILYLVATADWHQLLVHTACLHIELPTNYASVRPLKIIQLTESFHHCDDVFITFVLYSHTYILRQHLYTITLCTMYINIFTYIIRYTLPITLHYSTFYNPLFFYFFIKNICSL